MSDEKVTALWLLWAKTADRVSHPLLCHLIDVSEVTKSLWDLSRTEGVRKALAIQLGLSPSEARDALAFWAGLHDLGKACPAFQRKHPPAVSSLVAAGLSFPPVFTRDPCYHGAVTSLVLQDLLEEELRLPRRLARFIARAVGGHHGSWPLVSELQGLKSTQIGGNDWDDTRRQLFRTLDDLLTPPRIERLGTSNRDQNALLVLLSGLTSTADWIGSMERYFPYVEAPTEPADYAQRASEQARNALRELGWTGWQPPTQAVSFDELHGFPPRPMQQAVIELADSLERPALVIIEAPTGLGKTEAALYLADRWACGCQQRGLYIAMPTMTTSNQMFSRVKRVLAQRYPRSLVNLHLVHSQACWRDDVESLRIAVADEEDEGGTVAAMSWFVPRKRSLLAPFGVGTVDQVLLSVLQTRHFFVRLFGLGYKTIIFDEVHAYDTYMSAIFQRLLGWLRAVGASVVILSATLPSRSRRELLRAYLGASGQQCSGAPYPAIIWACGDQCGTVPLPEPEGRPIALDWVGQEPEAIVAVLSEPLREGGCAAVICNTVKRTQQIYKALKEAQIVDDRELTLFHARFPVAWRDEIEAGVLSRFGKEDRRPNRAIVVATQVIEQSLDLDFDLMVTELAPVDLVLQRAGRLHRHKRDHRPGPLSKPRLIIIDPTDEAGQPDFGASAYVYEPYVLLRSHLVLRDLEHLDLPADTTRLIEGVYGEEGDLAEKADSTMAAALEKARERMQRHQEEDIFTAQQKLIAGPETENLLAQQNLALEEDARELHKALQALTRLGPPSIPVVCLHQTSSGLSVEPDGSGPALDLDKPPESVAVRALSQHTLSLSQRGVFKHFVEQPVPKGWRKHALLHNHRVAVFVDGLCPLEDSPYVLRLSRELGLQIERR